MPPYLESPHALTVPSDFRAANAVVLRHDLPALYARDVLIMASVVISTAAHSAFLDPNNPFNREGKVLRFFAIPRLSFVVPTISK